MRLRVRLLLLCLPLLSLPAVAETLDRLYQVREPVTSQLPEDRAAALSRALDTLVLRLTGDPKALQNPALAELHKDPQQLILQFGYDGDAMLVDFDPVSTERSLRQAGLSLWGANRPLVLAWWLNETEAGAQLVGDDQSAAATPLRTAAQHRGLPLRLPLADLNEQLVATAENLAAAQPDALRPASERYAADALLAVQARENGGQWQADWRLWLGDQREQGVAQGADAAALSDAVMRAVAERLAPRFVATPGAAQALTLEVQGGNLVRYAELERLLEPFAARLQRVEGDRLTYRVSASAEPLRAQLSLAGLQEVPADAVPVTPAVDSGAPVDATTVLPTPAPTVIPAAAGAVLRLRW